MLRCIHASSICYFSFLLLRLLLLVLLLFFFICRHEQRGHTLKRAFGFSSSSWHRKSPVLYAKKKPFSG